MCQKHREPEDWITALTGGKLTDSRGAGRIFCFAPMEQMCDSRIRDGRLK